MHTHGLSHKQTAVFLQPKTFTDYVADNASDIKELLDAYPYPESFTDVLAVLRNLQEYHQQLPENFGSSFGIPEGILKFAVRKTVHALTLLKELPFHLEMPIIEREEQKRLVFNVILLAGLSSNIAHGDSSFRVDGFDSSQNKVASRKPGTSLADFLRTSGLCSVKLHLKETPDHDHYPVLASTILHRIGGRILDEIRNGSHTKLYVFLISYIERRYDHAELLDSQLFNVLSQAAHNVREENFIIHGNYLGEPQIPHMAAEIAKILCGLFRKEFSIETGNELKRKMVCMQDGQVYLRHPHAFEFISELFREQSPETLIPLNGATLISCMAKAGMLHVIPNSSLENKPFLEPNPDKRSSNTHVEVSCKAIRLISPESYLSESSLTFKELSKQRKATNPEHQFTESLQIPTVIPAHPTAGNYIAETKLTEQTKLTGRLTRQEAFIKIVGKYLNEFTTEALFPAKKFRKGSKKEMTLSLLEKEISNLMEQDKSAREKELLGHMKAKYSERNLFPYDEKKDSTHSTQEKAPRTLAGQNKRSLSSSTNKEQENLNEGSMTIPSKENQSSSVRDESLLGKVYWLGRSVKARLTELLFKEEEENKHHLISNKDYSGCVFDENLTCNFISKSALTTGKVSLSRDTSSVAVLTASSIEAYQYSSAFPGKVSVQAPYDAEENQENYLTLNGTFTEKVSSASDLKTNTQSVEPSKYSVSSQASEELSGSKTQESIQSDETVAKPNEKPPTFSSESTSAENNELNTIAVKEEQSIPVESKSAKNNAGNNRNNQDTASSSLVPAESSVQKKTTSNRRTPKTSSISDKKVTIKTNPTASKKTTSKTAEVAKTSEATKKTQTAKTSKNTKTSDKSPSVKKGKTGPDAIFSNPGVAPREEPTTKTCGQKSPSKKTLNSSSANSNRTVSKKDENTKNNLAKNSSASVSKDSVSTKTSGVTKRTTSSAKTDKDSSADKKSESRKTTTSSASGKSAEESKTKARKTEISEKTPDAGSSPRSRTNLTKTVGTGK